MAILKINLLPPRIKQARMQRLMILGGVIAAAVLLTIPAGLWYERWIVAASLRSQIRAIDAESATYAGIIDKVTLLEAQEAVLAKRLDVLDKLLGRQGTWIRVLESLSFAQAHAHDLWLTSVNSKALSLGADAGKVEIALVGSAFSAASIDEFMRTLSKADLNGLEMGLVNMTVGAAGGQQILNFNFTVRFKT